MPNVPELKNKILEFIRSNGPSIPVQISRILGSDTFFSGAMLSELLAEKKLKISRAKIGGSPVYYISGQESRLDILYKYLPQKEREAYDILQTKKIILDKEAEPAIRVALKSIIDFSIPINVNIKGANEPAYAWHLTNDDEIKEALKLREPIADMKKEEPKIEQRVLEIQNKPIKERKYTSKQTSSGFQILVNSFLQKNNLPILESDGSKKSKEANYVVKVPTNIGDMTMLVVAKDKKKINESDLSLAHNKGQNKGMPVIFLTSGEISKKAKTYMEKNLKGLLVFKNI